MSCLVRAAQKGKLDLVRLLIEQEKVDVNSIDVQVKLRHIPQFGRSLEDPGKCFEEKDYLTAMHAVAARGDIAMAIYLLEKGAHVDGCYSETGVHSDGHRLSEVATPLCKAIKCGQAEMAIILIQRKARINIPGQSLIHEAIAAKLYEVVNFLLNNGADINKRSDNSGLTPLALAMALNADKIVDSLLNWGADYRMVDLKTGFTPLISGIIPGIRDSTCLKIMLHFIEKKEGRVGVIEYLNNNNNLDGCTALHRACQLRNYDAVKLFNDYGADSMIRDDLGRLPEHYIKKIEIAKEPGLLSEIRRTLERI